MALVKLNNRGVRSATTFGSVSALGEMRFIKKLTASSDSELSFVDGTDDVVLDDTYKEYLFTFKDLHPSEDGKKLRVNFSADGGSNYNVTKTTTLFYSRHNEADDNTALSYEASWDLAQSTSQQFLTNDVGTDNDQSQAGFLRLFNPSSTTFVKHFMAETSTYHYGDYYYQLFIAGYCNTTSAVDAVQFDMSSGNIDAGDICLYGIN
jgi:hypothetical protein